MLTDFRVWVVIHEPARVENWRRVMAQSGWPVEVSDLASFSRRAADTLPGLALLDLAALYPQPQARVRELKNAAPAVTLLLTYSAPIPDALFKRITESKPTGSGQYMRDGQYLLVIKDAKLEEKEQKVKQTKGA